VLTPVGATLALWIVLASLVDPIDRWRRGLSLSRAVIGMTIAHLGLATAVIALTTVQSFTTERDVALAPGASASAGGYEFRFDGVRPLEGPNYDGVGGTIVVTRQGAPVTVLTPRSASTGCSARRSPRPPSRCTTATICWWHSVRISGEGAGACASRSGRW